MFLFIFTFCPVWFVLYEIIATYPTYVATTRKYFERPWKTEYG